MSGEALAGLSVTSGSDDLSDDIVGAENYEYAAPAKKPFLPWHRPRKQFVRNDQWLYYINQLIRERKGTDKRLTYFGLPGVDLLDIRYFCSAACEPNDIKLRFLGFEKDARPTSDGQFEFNISYDEVSKTPSFDPEFEIIPDDFRELVNEDLIAWQKTLEYGPYDVVNLDLCDGVGSNPPDEINETYYNAISKLITI